MHRSLFLPSPTSLTCLSSSGIFTQLSKNQLHPHCSRNQPWKQRSTFQLLSHLSNLSLISKIMERVIKSRLIDHLTSHNLINLHQFAYCKHHSTETAVLYICDHLINAIGSQKVLCLCLLDLSAAFDTIHHNILITHLFLVWYPRLCSKLVQILLVISFFL